MKYPKNITAYSILNIKVLRTYLEEHTSKTGSKFTMINPALWFTPVVQGAFVKGQLSRNWNHLSNLGWQ
jgi:hypothetical protein